MLPIFNDNYGIKRVKCKSHVKCQIVERTTLYSTGSTIFDNFKQPHNVPFFSGSDYLITYSQNLTCQHIGADPLSAIDHRY